MNKVLYTATLLIFILYSLSGCTGHNTLRRASIHHHNVNNASSEHNIKHIENKISNLTQKQSYSHTIFCFDLLGLDKSQNRFIARQPHVSQAQYNLRSSQYRYPQVSKFSRAYINKLAKLSQNKTLVKSTINKNADAKIREMQIFIKRLAKKIKLHRIRHTNPVREIVLKLDSYLTQTRKDLSKLSLSNKLLVLKKSIQVIENIPLGIPLESYRVSSRYKMRLHPITKKKSFHEGIDLVGKKYSTVLATANGKVSFAGWQSGYGKVIIIQHAKNSSTVYAHLDDILVNEGDRVLVGQKIGIQGNTGSSTNDHLHYEVRLRNRHVNPEIFVAF